MADLKYFISESHGFRAGDGYVEGGMMGGVGGKWQWEGGSSASLHSAPTMGQTLTTLEDNKMLWG